MTPPKRPLLVDPPAWLISAQSDLKLARLAHNQEDILPEQICFHAQQAVEKAFKAVLIAAKAEPKNRDNGFPSSCGKCYSLKRK